MINEMTKTEEFIKKAIEKHGDRYDYSKVEYNSYHSKIIIICKEHGEFNQTPGNHLTGYGCKSCGKNKSANNQKKTNDEFIKEAIEKHGEKYNYSKVDYINAKTKIVIICKEHGEFEQIPDSHTQGMGCKKCGRLTYSKNKTKTTEQFIKQAKYIHYDKYDYSKVNYTGIDNKIDIICKKHGEFITSPYVHLKGNGGCKECQKEKLSSIFKFTKEEFIKQSKEIHGDEYNYSKVEYINYATKVIIICKVHGEFLQTPREHLGGCKCGFCKGNRISLLMRSTKEEFIIKAQNIHLNKYDYSLVDYINSQTSVKIICNIHGIFEQKPNNHLNGTKCPKCNHHHSKIQLQWLNYIQISRNIIIQHAETDNGEFKIPNTRFLADGFCKETNTIYEFHGDFWHGNPILFNKNDINSITKTTFGELYEKTQKKKYKIQELGYNYIEIWEYDWRRSIKAVIKIQRLWRKNEI
jgi:hypothetical protein